MTLGRASLDHGGLAACEVGGLAIDLAAARGLGGAAVLTDRRALGLADLFLVVLVTIVLAAHVAVLLTAGHAATLIVAAVTLDLTVLGAFGATQAARTLVFHRCALLDANRRAALGAFHFGAGHALGFA